MALASIRWAKLSSWLRVWLRQLPQRQLSQKDQQLVQLSNRLDRQISDLTLKDHRETPYMSPNIMVDRTDMYPNGVVNPKIQTQIKQLEAQQSLIQLARRQMQAQYPALAAIDSATVANSSNTQLLGQTTKEFGKIQSNIKDLSQQIQKDPSNALFLDDVVSGTLQGLKIDPNNPAQAATHLAIVDYIQSEQNKANLIQWSERLLNSGLIIYSGYYCNGVQRGCGGVPPRRGFTPAPRTSPEWETL